MPASLPVDYNQAKLIYAASGSFVKASEQTGISYDAIKQRACREDWKTQVQEAKELVSLNVTKAIGTAALSLESKGKLTRANHAEAALKISEKVAAMDVDEAFLTIPNILAAAKHADTVHGWRHAQVNVGIRLDEIAKSVAVSVDLPEDEPEQL